MMGHVRRGEAERKEYSTSLQASTGLTNRYWFAWLKEPAKSLPVNPALNPRGYNP